MSPSDGPARRPAARQDGGWSWLVVACGSLALLLGYGSPQALGVLYPEWLLLFGDGKARTAWVGSMVYGTGLLLGPVCSMLVVTFGVRPVTVVSGVLISGGLMLSAFAPTVPFLILSYGVVVGVGVGLLYAAVTTVTCLYFDRRRGVALGVLSTGSSVGGVLYAPLQRWLLREFGLEGCLLIVRALALNVVACAGPMRPLTPPGYRLQQLQREEEASNQNTPGKGPVVVMETKEPPARRRSLFSCSAFFTMMKMRRYSLCLSSMLSLLQDRVLMALCTCLLLFTFGYLSPWVFLEDLVQSSGRSEGASSVSLVSLLCIGGALGRLGLGVMVDVPCVDSVLLYALMVAMSGLGVLLVPLTSSYLQLQVLTVVLGFVGGNWILTSYAVSQVVGLQKFTEANGILVFFGGVGSMLGPPVVGSFYDFTQSYDIAFYLSGSVMISGSLILFLAAVLPRTEAPPPPPPEAELISCTVTMATDAATPVT